MSVALTRRPVFWGISIFASFGIIAALRITGAIGATTGFILMVLAMLQLVPLTRAAIARQAATGTVSAAITRYNRRFMLASFGYMLGLGLAVTIADRVDLGQAESAAIALLPVIPVFAMIWTMARYLVEERDEFLRHRAIMASLVGLGAVLTLGTFWGFLETFDVAPHVDAWWVFPVWAIGMGLGQAWMALADRRAAAADTGDDT